MIGIGFKVEVKKTKLLTEPQRALALPLQEATQFLASMVIARIRTGRGPNGPWDTYASHISSSWHDHFWVAPGRPQPGNEGRKDGDGLLFRVKKGPWAGWAAYTSAKGYYEERGLAGLPHDFEETGALLKATAIRIVSPRHMRLAFYGGHGKLSAKKVGWLASRNESDPLLMPSKDEVEKFQRFIVGRINQAVIEGARYGEQAQRLTSASRSVSRRASRLLGD